MEQKDNRPYYIPEPFGLPFELTPKGMFKRLNEKKGENN